ncbi:polynucleotide adenylyltransferase [Umbelopsis nana]
MKSSNYGVTPPVSEAPPSPRELELTEALIGVIAQEGMIETEERTKLREHVLFELGLIVNEFVYRVTVSTHPHDTAIHVSAKLFTYGSYRLGAQTEDSDIDTLCACPQHITSRHFFTILPEMLRQRKDVTELTTVTDAFVPVIKLVISGVHIDLIYTRLWLPTVPADLDLSDDKIVSGLDENSMRTANGPRTANEILQLVPNVDTFRTALKCIKLWAKRRGIYSNAMGYLGGVAWAILVARVCQLYPNGCATTVISRFFRIFATWSWPSPVVLKHIDKLSNAWDPKKNKHHIMPIITPAFPSMCSTHNVSKSTKTVLLAELTRASKIVDKIMLGTATWRELFEEHNFFSLYKHYIRIGVYSSTPEDQLQWCGRIESRIRRLVAAVETLPQFLVVHPLIDGVSAEYDGLTYGQIQAVAFNDYTPNKLFKPPSNGSSKSEANAISQNKLYTTQFYIGLLLRPAHGDV